MPTAIAVTSGDLVLPPSDRHTPPPVVLQPPAEQTLEAAITGIHLLLEQHGYVIVLHSSALPGPFVRRLHTIRSMLESDRIALLPVDLPPLGLAVLALQLRRLSVCDVSPGVLASAARLLPHYIYAGALLSSVTKLDRVPVSLTAHAKSWVPGSQFAVLTSPRAQLTKVSGAEPGALEGPAFATRLLIARGRPDSTWVSKVLAPAWQVQGLLETALPADSADWWGTSRIVEFAAAIPDISILHQLVSSVRREQCRWCGLELIGDRCGFCSSPFADPHAQLERLPAQ